MTLYKTQYGLCSAHADQLLHPNHVQMRGIQTRDFKALYWSFLQLENQKGWEKRRSVSVRQSETSSRIRSQLAGMVLRKNGGSLKSTYNTLKINGAVLKLQVANWTQSTVRKQGMSLSGAWLSGELWFNKISNERQKFHSWLHHAVESTIPRWSTSVSPQEYMTQNSAERARVSRKILVGAKTFCQKPIAMADRWNCPTFITELKRFGKPWRELKGFFFANCEQQRICMPNSEITG